MFILQFATWIWFAVVVLEAYYVIVIPQVITTRNPVCCGLQSMLQLRKMNLIPQ